MIFNNPKPFYLKIYKKFQNLSEDDLKRLKSYNIPFIKKELEKLINK
jgi:hypothetical protein